MKYKLLLLSLTLFIFFTKAQVPTLDLQLWLKADVGVNPNTNNASVTLWTDQSGNGNSLEVELGGFDGTGIYMTNVTQKFIQFGSPSYLRKTTGVVWPINSTAITLFIVHSGALSGSQSTSLFNLSASASFDLSQGIGFPGTNIGAPVFRNGTFTVPFSTATTTQVSSVVFIANNAAITACQTFKNGVLVNSAATTGSLIPANIGAITLGSVASLNGLQHAYEILAYSTALNSTDRQTVENYLLAKYSAVLPLKLVNFIATKHHKNIMLYWQTETEINTGKFDIEFSANGSDFETIGSINAANKNRRNEYSFNDNSHSPADTRFYRLKIIEVNGKFS